MPRFAKKGTTRQDILDKMILFSKNHDGDEDVDVNVETEVIEDYLYCMGYSDSQPRADLEKVEFDFENSGDSNKGRNTLPDGTAIIWCWACGDWEVPVNFVVYIDNKNNLRSYIPNDGNTYCHQCKCAYGSCTCDTNDIDGGIEDHMDDEPDWDKMYDDVCNRIQTK